MSTTNLKLLAAICMLFSHICVFIPGIPLWFDWIGRLSMPIFIFCAAWGIDYTRDKKKYGLRLYLSGVLMAAANYFFNSMYPQPYHYLTLNIFVTIFLVFLLVCLINVIKTDRKKGLIYLVLFILVQWLSTLGYLTVSKSNQMAVDIIAAAVPNLFFNEGSIIFVAFGVMVYFTKSNKEALAKAYTGFSALWLVLAMMSGFSVKSFFYQQYQWMMIGALPVLLSYNHKKGASLKYFFYIFYPLHIFALYMIGNYMVNHP